jgi:hypothetical protein
MHDAVRLRRSQHDANHVEPSPEARSRWKPGSRTTVARPSPHRELVVETEQAVARVAVVLAWAIALVGCRAHDGSPPATSTAHSPASQGRPIGADADVRVYAVAAAVRFARGYLAFEGGRVLAERVPGATPQLRTALRRLPVSPASRSRRTEIVSARLERIDARGARVTVRVHSADERLTYPLAIDLVRRDGRWSVLSVGDDT